MNITNARYWPEGCFSVQVGNTEWGVGIDGLRKVYGGDHEEHTLETDTEAMTALIEDYKAKGIVNDQSI